MDSHIGTSDEGTGAQNEPACEICNGEADRRFSRREIWRDPRWRVTLHSAAALDGFCYLEPRRHIPYITDLNGDEARTFGDVLARVTTALQAVTACERVYVLVYGGTIAHLHVHLAPHHSGDPYCDEIVHGDIGDDVIEEAAFGAFTAAFATKMHRRP